MTDGLFDLSSKVAIVTGGNGGIGLGMAKGLAGAPSTTWPEHMRSRRWPRETWWWSSSTPRRAP